MMFTKVTHVSNLISRVEGQKEAEVAVNLADACITKTTTNLAEKKNLPNSKKPL